MIRNKLREFAEKNNQQIDCKKGCEWCCYQPVFALDYEMDYLNDFIQRNFDDEAKLVKRVSIPHQQFYPRPTFVEHNAIEIFGQPDVDGGLIGGAALKAESFMDIVNAFDK